MIKIIVGLALFMIIAAAIGGRGRRSHRHYSSDDYRHSHHDHASCGHHRYKQCSHSRSSSDWYSS